MKNGRSEHSNLTRARMEAAAARRADAARAAAPLALPVFAEAGLLRLGVDTRDLAAVLAFEAAEDSGARWAAAGCRPSGLADLREWAAEARILGE